MKLANALKKLVKHGYVMSEDIGHVTLFKGAKTIKIFTHYVNDVKFVESVLCKNSNEYALKRVGNLKQALQRLGEINDRSFTKIDENASPDKIVRDFVHFVVTLNRSTSEFPQEKLALLKVFTYHDVETLFYQQFSKILCCNVGRRQGKFLDYRSKLFDCINELWYAKQRQLLSDPDNSRLYVVTANISVNDAQNVAQHLRKASSKIPCFANSEKEARDLTNAMMGTIGETTSVGLFAVGPRDVCIEKMAQDPEKDSVNERLRYNIEHTKSKIREHEKSLNDLNNVLAVYEKQVEYISFMHNVGQMTILSSDPQLQNMLG